MYSRIVLILGILLVAVGIAEVIHPFGPAGMRSNPALVIVVGVLLAARHLAREAALKRKRMLEEVSDKPLGLD